MLYHKKFAVGAVVILLALSAWCFQYIPQGFFPDLSYTQLYIEYKVPEGGTLEAVQGDIAEIEAYLLSRPDITHVTSSFGGTPSRYNLVRSIALPAMSYGELIVYGCRCPEKFDSRATAISHRTLSGCLCADQAL